MVINGVGTNVQKLVELAVATVVIATQGQLRKLTPQEFLAAAAESKDSPILREFAHHATIVELASVKKARQREALKQLAAEDPELLKELVAELN